MNTYLLSYNVFETKISSNQLESFIKESKRISEWHRPFLGTYILKSNDALQTLSESFQGAFDGGPFILTLTYPYFMGGAQAPAVWAWVNGHPFNALNQLAIENKG